MAKSIKRVVRNISDKTDANIHIKRSSGHSTVRAIAVNSETGERIGKWKQRTIYNPALEDSAIRYLCNVLVSGLIKRKTSKKSVETTDTLQYWANALEQLGIDNLVDPNWAVNSTKTGTISYLRRQILPRMDAYGTNITDKDMADIRDTLITKAISNGRSRKNPDTAKNSVDSILYRINYILQQAYRLDSTLPRVLFPWAPRKSWSSEQAKSIPDPTRVKLAALLLRYDGKNGLALAVAMMLLCGLRTAEAAAVRIGKLVPNLNCKCQNYVVYFVNSQIKNGERIDYLKSDAAYRIVVGPLLLLRLVEARIEHLRTLGYTDHEILKMPLAGEPGTETEYPDPSNVSAFAKSLLLLAGYSEDAITAANALQIVEPDLDSEGKPDMDVTAYILRRDWCSRACNACGLSTEDVDYLIGHVNDTQVKDYTSSDTQALLANKLENYVFLPDYSRHPRYNARKLSDGLTQTLPEAAACTIQNDLATPVRIRIYITTQEPGTEIAVTSTGEALLAEATPYVEDNPANRSTRIPLGRSYSREYYETLQADTARISLPPQKIYRRSDTM